MERITTIFLPRGRPTKFTPARIQQIRTLVERGKSREETRRADRRDRWFAASHLLKGLRKLVLEAQVRGTRFWRARRHARYTSDGERPSSSKRRLLNIAAFNREQDSINYLIMEI